MELLELWERRRVQFEQCMELQLFNRDCEHADATMSKQEVGIHLSDLVVYHLTLKMIILVFTRPWLIISSEAGTVYLFVI